jgi:hypothetical protein
MQNKAAMLPKGVIMGFLDDLLKKVISSAAEKPATQERTERQPAPRPAPQSYSPPPNDMKAHFDEILKDEFSQFEIKENVSAENISAEGAGKGFRPYTYVLYKNGRASAAIMLTPHNRDSNKAFRGAKDMCRQAGVPFINFYTHFANRRDYVVNRIKSFVG